MPFIISLHEYIRTSKVIGECHTHAESAIFPVSTKYDLGADQKSWRRIDCVTKPCIRQPINKQPNTYANCKL